MPRHHYCFPSKIPYMEIDNFKIVTPLHKLILRPHRDEDAPFMIELNSDPEVTAYTPDGPLPSLDVAKMIIQSLRQQFMERQIGRFIVIDPKTNKAIGWCGLKWLEDSNEIDIGYRFVKSAWGRGIATETALSCLSYGFNQLHFSSITASVLPTNMASVRVLEKIGMKQIGILTEDGENYLQYKITDDDFYGKSKT